MKILFYFGHPAQYLFLRETIRILAGSNRHQCIILIKTKDVLEDLLKADGLKYRNILSSKRGRSRLSIAMSLLKRLAILFPIILRNRPDLMISTDATIAMLGKLLRIHRITITEDDYQVIKHLADLAYPYTETILCPEVCTVGKYDRKKTGYHGYMKLGYLHPNIFTPDHHLLKKYQIPEKFILIRLVSLAAHHDFGIGGISEEILHEIITLAKNKNISVLISSEKELDPVYESIMLRINPSDLHHIMAHASILISDSQSMSVESAMLGVPSIRVSGFTGKISVLEELEHTYHLTFGIDPGNGKDILIRLEELLSDNNLHEKFQLRRQKMLSEKIDVTAFLVWFIENYPDSVRIMKENPDYQWKFK